MTENKRFMLDDAGELIDKETAQFIEYGEKVCELLNELNDEIKELEIEYRRLTRFLMKNGYTISDYLNYCEENEFK